MLLFKTKGKGDKFILDFIAQNHESSYESKFRATHAPPNLVLWRPKKIADPSKESILHQGDDRLECSDSSLFMHLGDFSLG